MEELRQVINTHVVVSTYFTCIKYSTGYSESLGQQQYHFPIFMGSDLVHLRLLISAYQYIYIENV